MFKKQHVVEITEIRDQL